ncbi:MAG: outer membrane protein assembly complex, YaeT protein [Desulfomicrobiaceae bacterium]|jgi:outer membrane protein insertion porin family|nr:outer membrane protein assembly complex, YaeT protein [Desulfomicrobiaceae bacterium]
MPRNLVVLVLWCILALPAHVFAADSIMVLPFAVHGDASLASLEEDIPRLLADRFKAQGLSVVSQDQVDALLARHEIQFLDLGVVAELARRAGAKYAVYGAFSQVGDAISLDARVVDATGAKPPRPVFASKTGGIIQLLPAVEDLARAIMDGLSAAGRITGIEVRGTTVLDKDVVLLRLKVQKGDPFDPKALAQEVKRLYELGYFDDVRIDAEDDGDGKRIVVTVQEKPLIQAIDVEGAEEIDPDDILAAMSTKTGSVANLKVLAEDMNKIRELYRKKGYYTATVDYRIQTADSHRARLTVAVHEGKKLYVEEIVIQGAKQLSPSEIKDQLALSERGIFSWITGSGVLREEMLDRDAAAIEAYYANRGFLNARAGQPKVEFTDDGIVVTYQIEEGDRYRVDHVVFGGDILTNATDLAQITTLDDLAKDKEFLDRSVIRKDLNALSDHYSTFGYAFAEADVDIQRNEDAKTVAVTYVLRKGPKMSIGRVIIQGNTRTRDNVIRREMRLADGDLFNGALLRRSNARLTKLDFFETVEIIPEPTARPDTLDLRVKVKEKSTGMLAAGAGYSTYSKVFFSGQILERNLFGMGYQLGFKGTISSKSADYTATFWNPHYEDSDLGVGLSLYNTMDEYTDYDRQSMGGRLLFGYPLGEYTQLSWNYRLERYTIEDVDDDADQEIKDIEGHNWASALYVRVTRDTTDRRINPTKGSVNTLSVEYSGGILGGDDDFVKYIADTNWYFPLFWSTVFHAHAQGGILHENTSDTVPHFERFFLGGMNSVRGYETRAISPRYTSIDAQGGYEEGTEKGGYKSFFTNLEYIFPIHKEMGIMGVVFFDAGQVWDKDESLDFDLYKSVGAGIRWYSPLGPLRLEYGYPLDEIEGEKRKGRFEFAVGQFF